MSFLINQDKAFNSATDLLSAAFFVSIAGFFPLYYGGSYNVILPAKYSAFQIIALLFGGAFLILSAVKYFFKGKNPLNFKKTDISLLFLVAFSLFLVISAVFSPYFTAKNSDGVSAVIFGSGRYDGLYVFALYGVVFVISCLFVRFKHSHILFLSVILLVMSLFGIVQLFGVNLLEAYPSGSYSGYYDQFISTFGNIDFFSSAMCMLVPLTFTAYLCIDFSRAISAFLLFCSFAGGFCLVKTDIQSGIITLGVMALAVIPLSLRKRDTVIKAVIFIMAIALLWWLCDFIKLSKLEKSTGIDFSFNPLITAMAGAVCFICGVVLLIIKKFYLHPIRLSVLRKGIFILYAFSAVLILVYVRFFFKPTVYEGALFELYSLLREEIYDYSGSGRGGIWKYSFLLGLKRPLLGQGTGCYRMAMDEFSREVGYTYYTSRNALLDAAHNEFLQIFVTNGIFGLLSYLGFCLSLIFKSIKSISKNKMILPLLSAVAGYLIQSFFTFSIVEVTPIFWMFSGMLFYQIKHTEIDGL